MPDQPATGINIGVEGFQLSKRAQTRVENALKVALDRELAIAGINEDGVFGDGSVKGITQIEAPGPE